MPTVLRAGGKKFDVDAFLKKTKLKPYLVFHKGERRFKRPEKKERLKQSGLCLDTSRADFDDLPGQIRDTISFLKKNQNELKKLVAFPGVEAVIDFGYARRDAFAQFDLLPAELIRLQVR